MHTSTTFLAFVHLASLTAAFPSYMRRQTNNSPICPNLPTVGDSVNNSTANNTRHADPRPEQFRIMSEEMFPFIPPGPNDLRSPCPAVNTLANHGMLPRDGRNVDLNLFTNASWLGFNMGYDSMAQIALPGMRSSTTGNCNPPTVHLSDLKQRVPRLIEHEASLSRRDAFFGGAIDTLDQEQWSRTLARWEGHDIITLDVAAQELKARFDWSRENNANFTADEEKFSRLPALLQYGLLITTFGNMETGDGNKTLIKYFIENERMPWSLGWQPTQELYFPNNRLVAGNISAIWDSLVEAEETC